MQSSFLYGLLVTLFYLPGLQAASSRASLSQIKHYDNSPSGAGMFIYVPANVIAKPPIVVAIHYCGGTAQAYYYGSPYAELADQYGFIVIYPNSPYRRACWDVSSKETLTHNAGGDSNSIANMVTYALANYNGDSSRVFVTGSSSGAMMTNVLAATYPELFAAATAYSGVPAGCFVSSSDQVDGWNGSCAQGNVYATSKYWAETAFAMYPRYSGQRPRVQIYHGSKDTTLHPQNYNETVKQWTGVFGYRYTAPGRVEHNFPQKGYTTDIWGVDAENPHGKVQGIYAQGVGHTVPINGAQDMIWFGLGPYASSPSSSSAPPGTTSFIRDGGWHASTTQSMMTDPSPTYAPA